MSEKPILFNTEMVRAILDGRKTQTRRVIKPQPYCMAPRDCECTIWDFGRTSEACNGNCLDLSCAFDGRPYKIGDVLYVRETWNTTDDCGLFPNWPSTGKHYIYLADDPDCKEAHDAKWRPSIHMPREAARLFLRVKDVRCERLQDITNKDAKAEGVTCATDNSGMMHRHKFRLLWDSITPPENQWDANPWVWVIEFERMEKP